MQIRGRFVDANQWIASFVVATHRKKSQHKAATTATKRRDAKRIMGATKSKRGKNGAYLSSDAQTGDPTKGGSTAAACDDVVLLLLFNAIAIDHQRPRLYADDWWRH
jgi:hypothetical protein